jgi:hypothetical protein
MTVGLPNDTHPKIEALLMISSRTSSFPGLPSPTAVERGGGRTTQNKA